MKTSHNEHLEDRAAMLAMRAILKLQPAMAFRPEARPAFDVLMAKTSPAESVKYQPDIVAVVPGWWCCPVNASTAEAILYLHGGAYIVGTAWAYRNFVGQIAARAGVNAFIPDYGLAPERPFPAAFDDAVKVYSELAKRGRRMAIVGDSAGGGLALGLLSWAGRDTGGVSMPNCGVLMSPWADLSLSGTSMRERASFDPLLSSEMLAEAAALYLNGVDRHDPRASTLFGSLTGLPPMMLHVGTDEVLLDDAERIASAITAASGTVELHIWQGMVHVFPANLMLKAAEEAVASIGEFIQMHLCGT